MAGRTNIRAVPEIKSRQSYTAHQVRYAWRHWREETGKSLPRVIVAVCVAVVVALSGAFKTSLTAGIWSAVIGAIGGPLLVALFTFAWKIFAAPSAIWNEQKAEIETLKGLVAESNRVKLNSAITARLDLLFGERSTLSPTRRREIGLARFEELEGEIAAGNYTNAAEVLESQNMILRAVAAVNPTATACYREFNDRMIDIVAKIEQHFRNEVVK